MVGVVVKFGGGGVGDGGAVCGGGGVLLCVSCRIAAKTGSTWSRSQTDGTSATKPKLGWPRK